MNDCFFIGKINKVGDFKFIFNGKGRNKAVIKIVLELVEGTIIECKGYDEIADDILRNGYEYVFINGVLKSDGIIRIISITEMEKCNINLI